MLRLMNKSALCLQMLPSDWAELKQCCVLLNWMRHATNGWLCDVHRGDDYDVSRCCLPTDYNKYQQQRRIRRKRHRTAWHRLDDVSGCKRCVSSTLATSVCRRVSCCGQQDSTIIISPSSSQSLSRVVESSDSYSSWMNDRAAIPTQSACQCTLPECCEQI